MHRYYWEDCPEIFGVFKMQETEYLPEHCEDCSRSRQSCVITLGIPMSMFFGIQSISVSCLLVIPVSFHFSYLSVLLPQEN